MRLHSRRHLHWLGVAVVVVVVVSVAGYIGYRKWSEVHQARIIHAKQLVATVAQRLEERRQQGRPLPANATELANVLGGAVPTSPWGRPLSYQRLGNDFTVFTMTPWPEVLVIHYDSRDADGVRKFPF